MDIHGVITLGKLVNVPLIGPPSELVDGFEPHSTIYLRDTAVQQTRDRGVAAGGVPGVEDWVGTWEGLYRVLTHPSEAWPD